MTGNLGGVPAVRMQETLEALRKGVARSKRTGSVRFPLSFARAFTELEEKPPLAQLVSGGGGRLSTYLTIVMLATKEPHQLKMSSKDLADMLDRHGRQGPGPRRIANEIKTLEELKLLKVERAPGLTPTMTVLTPDGSGESWNARELRSPYLALPIGLWQNGWILSLAPRDLAVWIALHEFMSGRKQHTAMWMPTSRKQSYGLSEATWTRGGKGLVEAGLLEIDRVTTSYAGEVRRRNLYALKMEPVTSKESERGGQLPEEEGADRSATSS
ncbi:hypothetical protein GGG17_02845 [Arsenicicoccus sp. MKL-02]|uniref:Uncharacterized protein n=1 Tax=Arsenicicoccus cauae TaxID=2663847 RepID=A0A6I3IGP0_9MICO|nr:hypothetical protein [Arsenicicoccus cauae]MTB70925.1 hypothetical protein [Arsenicicoccus cauae]